MDNKSCSYRHCINTIQSKRKNVKYCSDSCRASEHTLTKRDGIKDQKEKQEIANLLKQFNNSTINKDIVDLYYLIKNK